MGSKTIAEIAEEVEEIATLELMKKCFGKDEHIFEDEGNYTIKDKGIYIAGCFYSITGKLLINKKRLIEDAETFCEAYHLLFKEEIDIKENYEE